MTTLGGMERFVISLSLLNLIDMIKELNKELNVEQSEVYSPCYAMASRNPRRGASLMMPRSGANRLSDPLSPETSRSRRKSA